MHRIEEIVTIYSKRVWIRRDKNNGRRRERGRKILMLRVVERWKGKGGRKIEVVGRWNGKGEKKVGEV